MRHLLFILCSLMLLLLSTEGQAQLFDKNREAKRARANENINDLRSGFLLVRLHTKAPSIEKLRELGRHQEADDKESEIREENLKIVSAFRSKFKFAPVYFFYSSDSDLVREGRLEAVSFLNDSLQHNPDIRPPALTKYITADFAQTVTNKEDTEALRPYRDPYLKDYPGRVGGTDFHSYGLIFRDSELRQLGDPFPYFIKARETFFKRSFDRIVQIANQRLLEYR